MRLRFGAHQGRTTEALLLRAPDYAEWVLGHSPGGAIAKDFGDLIDAFDSKELRVPCTVCARPARRLYAYRDSAILIPRCESCTLYQDSGAESVARPISSFREALDHVSQTFSRAHRRGKRRIIRKLAAAKGCPARITEATAAAFFQRVWSNKQMKGTM